MSLKGDFSCDIKVLDQPVICDDIPWLRRGICKKELRENKIWLIYYENDCPDIDLLIADDYCGKIFTKIRKLTSNLIACQTHLGWNETSSRLETSFLIKNSSEADMYKLDTLGINDHTETKTKDK